jgi:hypothetical protein
MFDVRFQGLRIAPSRAAMRELMKLGMSLEDVKVVLDEGITAPRKRAKGTIEKWLQVGKKTYNAVVVQEYHEVLKEEVWLLVHFGRF